MTHPLPVHNLKIKKKKSLLAMIENAIKGGDNYFFRNLYADEAGKEIDILEDGKNACAAFLSWTLLALELIKYPHSTVHGTEKDLMSSGWHEIQELKPGAVLIWQNKVGTMLNNDDVLHSHIGFYIGSDEAISNDSSVGYPRQHHYTYNNTRKIEKILWHESLND